MNDCATVIAVREMYERGIQSRAYTRFGNMNVMKLPFYLGLAFALLGVVIITIELPRVHRSILTLLEDDDERVTVWTVSKDANRLALERSVLKYVNFRERNGVWSGKWDVMWSVEYPFRRFKERLRRLHTHQRINHFPGMSRLTIKKYLATKFSHCDFIPRGFTLPAMREELREFTEKRPDVRLVEKNWNNRGVKLLRNINEMNFESFNAKEKFLQAFVERPYLIDGKMFDMGVYVIVTSFDPLRVYKFDKEILLRFCSEDYHPLDEDNTKKYVVDDSSIYVWNVDSLKDYVQQRNYTAKASLEEHMRKMGHDMTDVYAQIDAAITKLLLENESEVISEARDFGRPSDGNFFELLRFDFILDERLRIHLMEINMSPHLTTAKDFDNVKRNYRSQLLYDTLHLALVHLAGKELTESESDFILSDARDVTIPLSACTEADEREECGAHMSEHQQQIVHRSYREHVRRGGRMRRIFPTSKHSTDRDLIARVSAANRFSIKWFHAMCRVSKDWC